MAQIKDVVLIYVEDRPAFFARVESILPDAKKDWYHIKLLLLQIPLQVITWILKDEYISGQTFSMNGKSMRMETVECPIPEPAFSSPKDSGSSKNEQPGDEKQETSATVISFSDLKKKNDPEPG